MKQERCYQSNVMNIIRNFNLNEKYYNVVKKHRVNNENDTGYEHEFHQNHVQLSHQESNYYFERIIPEMYNIKKIENSVNVIIDLEDYNSSYDIISDQLL